MPRPHAPGKPGSRGQGHIRGLYTIDDHPFHAARPMHMASPDLTSQSGDHFITPADFATIYDLPSGTDGSGENIGIVGVSRTDFADFTEFRGLTGTSFPDPIEIVPTAFGGVDPGPALTAPPSSGGPGGQGEATLDVLRAGSTANGAQIKLVVATSQSGGIGVDAQYLVQTTPLPAQVMTISFGACESEAGASGVTFWDSLFQQAASEGVSVFVSSGDAGASGCDSNFATPPAAPAANSPNYICSSSYATCVGGTEFNDTGDPSQYWSASNSSALGSATSYIPEGAWNEPLNDNSEPQAAASGGVSSIIATPSWQTGTGVPTARKGRYTPDIAFSASAHDGYFACFAAAGASCVPNTQGEYEFEYFFGTSAAAPAMAGIAAILDASGNAGQGNLNPQLYSLAATAPSVFHDVTVATSGVSGCTVDTPSMCNNSIPGPTGLTGGQAGYLVNDGYDEVTGLGSLDVQKFLETYPLSPAIFLLTNGLVYPFGDQPINTQDTVPLGVENSGTKAALNPLTIKISGSDAGDFSETDNCNVAIDPGASCTVQMAFTPSALGARTATITFTSSNAANSPVAVTLTGTGTSNLPTPQVSVSSSSSSITTAQALTITITVAAPSGSSVIPSGTVTLAGGGYTSPSTKLSSGSASISIAAGALSLGTDPLTATYSGDTNFQGATGIVTVKVTAPVPPSFSIQGTSVSLNPGATTGNNSTITITPAGGFTGTVALTASITSTPANAVDPPTLSFGSTGSVVISGTSNGAATLTVATTAGTVCPQSNQRASRGAPWYAAGGVALASILMLGFPAFRRKRLFPALLLLAAAASAITACGGGGGGSSTCQVETSEPLAGTYTITVTGASGGTTGTGTIALTVQ